MKSQKKGQTKADFSCKVVFNQAISPCFYKLRVKFESSANLILVDTIPGQFCEIKVDNLAKPLTGENHIADKNIILRRPFSFLDVQEDKDGLYYAEILYCVLGEGTKRMTSLCENDNAKIIAPLGNGYKINEHKKNAILIAGGMGAPPLQFLAKNIQKSYPQMKIFAFVGAKTVKGLPFFHIHKQLGENKTVVDNVEDFSQFGAETFIATDDGSAGFTGFVTELAEKVLKEQNITPSDAIIYACGPEPMLKSAASLADKLGIECQVSMERLMACGIGLCQSCAVECKGQNPGETVYKLCCKDGPVFDSRQIVW